MDSSARIFDAPAPPRGFEERVQLYKLTHGRRSTGHFSSWVQFERFAEASGVRDLKSGPSSLLPFGVKVTYYLV